MGVTGLWQIVQPCARPIKIETLNRKRLAVDASIWIYQFLKAVRDKDGKIIQAAAFQKGEDETKPGRVQPDRRWFGTSHKTACMLERNLCELLGNTRVISQTALDHFRTSLAAKQNDPYSVLLRRNKLPMALLDDAANPNLRKVRLRCFMVR